MLLMDVAICLYDAGIMGWCNCCSLLVFITFTPLPCSYYLSFLYIVFLMSLYLYVFLLHNICRIITQYM